MKSALKLISPIVVLLFLFSGCKKDATDLSTINAVKINGNSFSITSASMIGVSIGEDGHTGINLVSGTGQQISTLTIDVESFTRETIEGTYSYPTADGDKVLDDWLTNYAYFKDGSGISSNLESGTVSIRNNHDNNYTIDMDLTMVDGMTFTGSYTGDFTVQFANYQ